MIIKEKKQEIIGKFGKSPKNTGSPAVQIALLTERINGLVNHFNTHRKDHTSKRGLLKMVGARRRLLSFLRREDPKGYQQLLGQLGLRK